jgi:hypothetical protein
MGVFVGLAACEIMRCLNISSTSDRATPSPKIKTASNYRTLKRHTVGALVDVARDAVMEGTIDQRFAVEVRNGNGPVLEVGAVFYSTIRRKQ